MKKEYSKIVYMSFIRIIKNNDKYDMIKRTLYNVFNNKTDTPFNGVKSVESLCNKLYEISVSIYKDRRRGNDEYEFITILVNTLIHYLYEPICENKNSLPMFGQEVFDLACYKIFGDKYITEMDSLNGGIEHPKNEDEAMMISEYMNLIQNGKDISWDKFKKLRQREIHNSDNEFNMSKNDDIAFNEFLKYINIIN